MTMAEQAQYHQPESYCSWLDGLAKGVKTVFGYVQKGDKNFYKALGKCRDMTLDSLRKTQDMLYRGDVEGLKNYNKEILDKNLEYAKKTLGYVSKGRDLSLVEVNMGLTLLKSDYRKIGRKY